MSRVTITILQNCYKRGFDNNSASAEGLHTFYSDRRDKYRIFVTGEKVNQRKKSDLIRFSKLKFIATQFFHLLQNPENAFYPGFYESCFFEAIFKFSRINENHINEMYLNMFQIILIHPKSLCQIFNYFPVYSVNFCFQIKIKSYTKLIRLISENL